MEDALPLCVICGEPATHNLGVGPNTMLCNNIVCYTAIKETIVKLVEAEGELCPKL